jgi:type IV secretion system protein VirB9
MSKLLAPALAVCLAAGSVMVRAQTPDPRLRVMLYDPQRVVPIRVTLGDQMMIEFAPDERIENVALGNSLSWQAIPSKQANLLFVKPMDRAPTTNMAVVTNLRRYMFELGVRKAGAGSDESERVYSLRFDYPPPPARATVSPPAPRPPQDVNHAYSYEGSAQNLPSRLFDDGEATYFRFPDGSGLPAIFAREADQSESVVNFHQRDGYIIIDRIARGFVLRRGKEETRIFNDGFREATPGPLSPQPRKKSGGNSK